MTNLIEKSNGSFYQFKPSQFKIIEPELVPLIIELPMILYLYNFRITFSKK